MTSVAKRIIPFLTVLGLGVTWLIAWIQFVDPFPDRDSINQFYFPFLNYLQASKLLSIDTDFLINNSFSTSYPTGGAIFPWLISKINAQSFFIKNPFYIFLILLPFIACVPYFFKTSVKSRLLIGILILALPMTQLSLKGFSLQGFNVVFCLIAILAFRSYLARRHSSYLIVFIICFLACNNSQAFRRILFCKLLNGLFNMGLSIEQIRSKSNHCTASNYSNQYTLLQHR